MVGRLFSSVFLLAMMRIRLQVEVVYLLSIGCVFVSWSHWNVEIIQDRDTFLPLESIVGFKEKHKYSSNAIQQWHEATVRNDKVLTNYDLNL